MIQIISTKKKKIFSDLNNDEKNKLDFKKVEIRNSAALNPTHNNIIGKINDSKLLKTNTIINQKKINFYFKKNSENSEEKNDSEINSISKINVNNKNIINNQGNFSPHKRITPIKQIVTKSTDEIFNLEHLNSNIKKNYHNTDGFFKGDTKSTNIATKMISSNLDDQNLKIKTELSCDLDLEPYSGMNQYDLVIFSGDLNYRINMEKEEVKKLIDNKDFETLLEKDQLYSAMNKKEIDLDDFYEGRITFLPTYKFLDGTSEYDYAKEYQDGLIEFYIEQII